jgi:hypothetical protein
VNGVYSLIHHFLYLWSGNHKFYNQFLGPLGPQVSQNSRIPNSSVVGDHFNSTNMEIKKKIGTPPTKIHWSEGALFEVRFLEIQASLPRFEFGILEF